MKVTVVDNREIKTIFTMTFNKPFILSCEKNSPHPTIYHVCKSMGNALGTCNSLPVWNWTLQEAELMTKDIEIIPVTINQVDIILGEIT